MSRHPAYEVGKVTHMPVEMKPDSFQFVIYCNTTIQHCIVIATDKVVRE
jgi:hypothetical protein